MTSETKTIALVGNAGVGKTTVFETLICGRINKRQVSGSKTELSQATLCSAGKRRVGRFEDLIFRNKLNEQAGASASEVVPPSVLVDVPGTTMLFSPNADDSAIASLLINGEVDTFLFVADAKNLRRSIASFLQVAQFGIPMVFVLNMTDEARALGLEFDLAALSGALSVEVIKLSAVENKITKQIQSSAREGMIPEIGFVYPGVLEAASKKIQQMLPDCTISKRALSLMILAGNEMAKQFLYNHFDNRIVAEIKAVVDETTRSIHTPVDVVFATAASEKAAGIAKAVSVKSRSRSVQFEQLGRWASHPLYGVPIALLVLFVGYLWVGVFGATIAVDYIDQGLFRAVLLPMVNYLLNLAPQSIVTEVIVDPNFGLLPSAIFLAVGIVFPVLFLFYIFFGVLEDSGYLPRLSVLMDKGLRLLGLDGKGVFPLVFGLSCVTSALLTTRILKSRKQRIITSFLLILSYPCAPLLTVMLVVLAPLSWTAAVTLFGVLAVQTFIAGVIANRVMAGTLPDFIMELPPLRVPRPKTVVTRAFKQSISFLKEALPIFIVAALVLFTLDRLGALYALENLLRPVVNGFLGLPDQSVQIFIKTIVRRESGAAELVVAQENFTGVQLIVTLFVMTVLVPCLNTTVVLVKELGVKMCVLFLSVVTVYALVVGGVLNHACNFFNITFS